MIELLALLFLFGIAILLISKYSIEMGIIGSILVIYYLSINNYLPREIFYTGFILTLIYIAFKLSKYLTQGGKE